jgi:CRISPR-associated protein Cmr2
VLHEDIFDRPVTGPPRDPALTPEQRRQWYGVHGAERLCGVGLLKRWGVQPDAARGRTLKGFFSTPHLAALPLMLGIDGEANQEIRESWRALCAAAGPAKEDLDVMPGRRTGLFGETDGAILFPRRLSETLADCGHPRDSQLTQAALEALKGFLKKAGRGEPIPYYAILVADGDGMGQIINDQQLPEQHRALSRKLDGFARDARRIVEEEEHHGCLIYSGGDDVLAFLPLHQAIECALALAQRFAKLPDATLSAGLAIVHYIDSMSAALEVARDAEKIAKRLPGKNALAVALDKRSGETTVVCDRWEALAPRLLDLAALHEAEAIPDKAGYELAALERLGNGLGALQHSEALRILGRKRARRGKEEIAADTLQRLKEHLGDDPTKLGHEIAIAALIAKAKAQAGPRREEGA